MCLEATRASRYLPTGQWGVKCGSRKNIKETEASNLGERRWSSSQGGSIVVQRIDVSIYTLKAKSRGFLEELNGQE